MGCFGGSAVDREGVQRPWGVAWCGHGGLVAMMGCQGGEVLAWMRGNRKVMERSAKGGCDGAPAEVEEMRGRDGKDACGCVGERRRRIRV